MRALLLTVAAGVLLLPTRLPALEQQIRVHYTPRDQMTQRYAYVPIAVPAGISQITVTYAYESLGGANVIDLGLYEPGPLTFGTKAFRGWTGGARSRIVVGTGETTPGYWPGPIPAGEWHLGLGLYKVAPAGVDVTVTVELSRTASGVARVMAPRQRAPIRRGPAWYVGIGHSHTLESDGALSTTELIEKARAEGLDFLAITDHNNTAHQLSSLDRSDLLVISGEEVTTPAGHFNVWGLGGARDYADFRIQPGNPVLPELLADLHRRGAAVSINHPVADCLACTWTHGIPAGIDAIEIANGTESARQQAMAIWDSLLRAGRRITAVEGRDWHRGTEPLGAPALRVWASELSTPAVVDAILHGRAVVVADARLAAPELTIVGDGRTVRVGETLTLPRGHMMRIDVSAASPEYRGARVDWVWNGEPIASTAIGDDGRAAFERYASTGGYGRVHVFAAGGAPLAVTNPIFVSIR